MDKREKIAKATEILRYANPQSPFEYQKWKKISRSDITKIAVLRVLSPQTRVSNLRSLEFSSDLDDLLSNLSNSRIEDVLRKHKIRFPKRKINAVNNVRSIDWMNMIQGLEKFSGTSIEKEREARLIVMDRVFGMGLKTTSDFLKDIGFSKHLAVLDSRNLNFLESLTIVPLRFEGE